MNLDDVFPSKYLKADDLRDREVTVTIARIVIEEIGQSKDRKPVVYFQGKDKGVAFNKTNSNKIASVFGKNLDGWVGRQIVLFPAWVDYKGEQVRAIRVRPAMDNPQAPAAPPPQPLSDGYGLPQSPPRGHPAALDDDIPFAPSF